MTVRFDFNGPVTTPRDAATVLLLRDGLEGTGEGPGEGPDGTHPAVFFVKRNAGARFMGGAYVFPGGRLDPGDTDPGVPCDLSPDLAAAHLDDPVPTRARGLFIAALRECLEESGVLLATEPVPPAVTSALRAALHLPSAPSLCDALTRAGITLRASGLVPFSRWVTPRAESRRFDARFFLARCPPEAWSAAVHDGGETVASAWLTAREALDRALRREIVLAPPTWRTLEVLAHGTTVDALLSLAPASLAPVEPEVTVEDGLPVVILPPHPTAPTRRFRYDDGAWVPTG